MALESKVAQQASVTVQIRPRGLAVSQSQYRLCGRTISTMIYAGKNHGYYCKPNRQGKPLCTLVATAQS
jgi:hypothetical protein